MARRLCLGRWLGRTRNIRAMAQEAGDADHTNDASVDSASRGNRKYRPGHRGRVPAAAELKLPDPPWWGAWLQRTNLWPKRTNLRPRSERPLGRSALRCGLFPQRRASGPRPARIPVWPGSLPWQRRTNLWPERTNLRTGSERLSGVIRRLDPEALAFFGLGHRWWRHPRPLMLRSSPVQSLALPRCLLEEDTNDEAATR